MFREIFFKYKKPDFSKFLTNQQDFLTFESLSRVKDNLRIQINLFMANVSPKLPVIIGYKFIFFYKKIN